MCHPVVQGGISAGVAWNNMSSTSVPAIEFDLSQTGNEGAKWAFQYCTGGDEPDPDTNCTNHVQTTNLIYAGAISGTSRGPIHSKVKRPGVPLPMQCRPHFGRQARIHAWAARLTLK